MQTYEISLYTLFKNGRHFTILLFVCNLALVASFMNSKLKRILYVTLNEAARANLKENKKKYTKMAASLE